MSKRKSTSAAAARAEEYDSDGGFVSDDLPRSKKVKQGGSVGKKEKKEAGKEKEKEKGKEVGGGGQVGRDGEEFWEVCMFDV